MTDDCVFAKCAWRLIPIVIAAYVVNYLDRTNVGFAALTMNKELGFTPAVYGLGAGLFFASYGLFQVPSNIMLHKVGARRWIFLLLATWGAASASSALIQGRASFYALRFLLGVAEAGLVPGIILYLTFWFPKAHLGRATAMFMSATNLSLIIGGPIASIVLGLDGIAGIRGWRWLFLIEGVPPLLMAVTVLIFLPNRPGDASWLSDEERSYIAHRIQQEDSGKERNLMRALRDPRVLLLGIAYGCILFGAYGLAFWIPLIVQGMGFSTSATGYVTALLYLMAMPAMIFWGRSSDRRGERIWHVAIPALFASAALALASMLPGNLFLLFALAAAAVGASAVLAPFYSLPPLFLSGPAMAGGFALVNTIANLLGGFAGQYLIGIIREQFGSYAPALAVIAVVLIVPACIVLALGRTMTQHSTAAIAMTADA
jgi:ACS family tartrate transporter-like MFS transporter